MDPIKLKNKVLEDLMSVLDEEDGAKLMKHPKVLAAKVTIAKPMGKEMPMGEGMPKIHEGEEMPEMPEMEGAEMPETEGEPEGLMDILEDIAEVKELPVELKAKLMKFIK